MIKVVVDKFIAYWLSIFNIIKINLYIQNSYPEALPNLLDWDYIDSICISLFFFLCNLYLCVV